MSETAANQRIAVLGHSLRVAGGKAVGLGLMGALPRVAPASRFLMIAPAGQGYGFLREYENVELRELPLMSPPRRIAWEKTALKRLLAAFKPDWLWCLVNYGLASPPCRQSILVHDSHLIYPASVFGFEGLTAKLNKRLIKRFLRRSLPATERVYCQTETIAARFSEAYGYARERVALCPPAVDSFPEPESDPPTTPEPLRPYADRFKLLMLAKCYGHKNHLRIVEAYERYPDELAGTVCFFTIAAEQHPIAAEILERLKAPALADRVVNLGPIERAAIPDYFAASDAMIMPSLLETFGIPYLEAMHFGVPVIGSDRDFCRDVCGEAALYPDPLSPASIRDAIVRLRDEAGLRRRLVEAGREQLRRFPRDWEQIAAKVLDLEGIAHQRRESAAAI